MGEKKEKKRQEYVKTRLHTTKKKSHLIYYILHGSKSIIKPLRTFNIQHLGFATILNLLLATQRWWWVWINQANMFGNKRGVKGTERNIMSGELGRLPQLWWGHPIGEKGEVW